LDWGGEITELPLETKINSTNKAGMHVSPCFFAFCPNIYQDGSVSLCACAGADERFVIGDIKKESLTDILSSAKRREMILSFIRGQVIEYCAKCSFYWPMRSINWNVFKTNATTYSEPMPTNFYYYNYAKYTHFDVLQKYSKDLYADEIDPDQCDLKEYQDLIVFSFIRNTIPPGSRILEVGGGNSRLLAKLHSEYECWNVDKFEGLGNGPIAIEPHTYKLIKAYMGEFSNEIPDNYFDFVFSVSALEHVDPNDSKLHQSIVQDINRVLKYGGYSLHCFDVVVGARLERDYYDYIYHWLSLEKSEEEKWSRSFKDIDIHSGWNYIPKIVDVFFSVPGRMNKMPTDVQLSCSSDLWTMSESLFNKTWKPIVKYDYSLVGCPTSLNALWKRVE
jgi:hypothetical protein